MLTGIDLAVLLMIVFPAIAFVSRVVLRPAYRFVHVLAIASTIFSTAASSYLLYAILTQGSYYRTFRWLSFGKYSIEAGYYLDPLSSSMLLVVWAVSLCVQVYSLEYMKGDRRFSDYFAFLSLFSLSMSGLVISSNLALTFVFWELVGLCSFLLIGFWYERESAINAAIKAFVTTRFGDTAFLVGIIAILATVGTLDITEIAHSYPNYPALLSVAALLLFVGAAGKSAQFPLHVWLPDAMEGPTPVSALIHAATMVAAGVYLIARVQFLFVDINVRSVVLAVGVVTALIAALMAVFQRDVKKVLAFSTISQLGYMMAALGVAASYFGVYHLYAHAFFKALLFLAAGSIYHAAHTLDLNELGGLVRRLRWTAVLFLIGALNLAGFPLTGGFFSKDSVIYGLKESGLSWAYFLMIGVTFLTSFYIFKVFFRVFLGDPPSRSVSYHESPYTMLVPMLLLAVLSFALIPLSFVKLLNEFVYGHFDLMEALPSTIASLAGIAIAYIAYGLRKLELENLRSAFGQRVYSFFTTACSLTIFTTDFSSTGSGFCQRLLNFLTGKW